MTIKIYLGVMGSGKSFRSQQLVEQGYDKISVADPMRETLWKILGWKPRTDAEYNAFKQHELIDVTNEINTTIVTGRSILQNIGETFKNLFGRDYWAKEWYNAVIRDPKRELNQNIVCDDVRFPEEVKEAIRMKENWNKVEFIFCNYNSDRYNSNNSHISERYAQMLLAMNKYKDGDIISIEDLLKVNEQFYNYQYVQQLTT